MPQRFEAILIGACESQRVEAGICSHLIPEWGISRPIFSLHLVARSGVILCINPQSESSTYIFIHIWSQKEIMFTFGTRSGVYRNIGPRRRS